MHESHTLMCEEALAQVRAREAAFDAALAGGMFETMQRERQQQCGQAQEEANEAKAKEEVEEAEGKAGEDEEEVVEESYALMCDDVQEVLRAREAGPYEYLSTCPA